MQPVSVLVIKSHSLLTRYKIGIECHVVDPPFRKYLNTTIPAVATSAAANPAITQYEVAVSASGPQRCLQGKKIK